MWIFYKWFLLYIGIAERKKSIYECLFILLLSVVRPTNCDMRDFTKNTQHLLHNLPPRSV